MKKVLSLLIVLGMGLGMAFAQTPATKKASKTTRVTSVKKTTATKTASGKPATKVTQKTEKTVAVKKDGTPDKRYKENKTTVTTKGPVKKDGTADMRYKTNKKAVKKH